MYRNEIIEIISGNENKELNNWYYSNIKSLTKTESIELSCQAQYAQCLF